MNIWIINQYASTPETGLGGRHYLLAKELVQMGHSVRIICASFTHLLRQPHQIQERHYQETVDGVNFSWIKVSKYNDAHSKKRIWNWFLFSHRLKNLHKVVDEIPDVVLVSSPSLISFLGARKLARKTKAKLFFEVRDIWPLTLVELGGVSERHPFIRYLQWIEDTAYATSDGIISNLPNSVDHMVSRGMNRDKFTWIPNGFSFSELEAQEPLDNSTLEQIPKNKFIVGYLGTLGVANSLDYFVEAAKLLKDKREIMFLLVGQGRQKEALKEMIEQNSLSNVRILQPIPKLQVQSMLKWFDVCYIGLTKDPIFRFGVSPNKLFDYFISAKPVLYAINSGNKPVDESNSGISIDAEDSEQIADAVLKFYAMSAKEREILGENGKDYAVKNYSYSDLAKKLITVFNFN